MIYIATADPLLTTGWMLFSGRASLKLSIGNLTADPNTTAQRGTYGAVWADKKGRGSTVKHRRGRFSASQTDHFTLFPGQSDFFCLRRSSDLCLGRRPVCLLRSLQ